MGTHWGCVDAGLRGDVCVANCRGSQITQTISKQSLTAKEAHISACPISVSGPKSTKGTKLSDTVDKIEHLEMKTSQNSVKSNYCLPIG